MGRARVAIAGLALALVVARLASADFDAGQRAWDAGNVDKALSQWRSASDEGDRRAMRALGRLYLQGMGVLQDYVEAHKWLNLAASRGEAAALAERDALAAKMTPEQIATAQERAAAWRSGKRPAGDAPVAPAAQAGTSSPAPASAPDVRRPPPRAIREAQALLAALGYRPGPVDGIWGRRTGAAYRGFLRDAGLPQTETLTPQALRALRAVAERQSAGGAGRGAPAAVGTSPTPASREASAPRPASVRPDALHRAAQVGDIEVLKAALAAGVDVDARDGRGWTALMHAVNKDYPLLVEPLLSAGADPDLRAPDGATALFIAALHGYSETVALLMKAGADISIRGPKSRTPLDMARSLNHSRILALPKVVAFEEARVRDEAARRAEADTEAFTQAQAQDSKPAYVAYMTAWCPQGNHCASARARVDGLLREGIVGRTFGGMNSENDPQSFQFLPSGEVVAQIGRGHGFSGCTRRGTWRVEDGTVVINGRCKGHSFFAAHAALDGNMLAGNEVITLDNLLYRGQEFHITWRLTERTAAEIEAEKTAATRERTFQSDGK